MDMLDYRHHEMEISKQLQTEVFSYSKKDKYFNFIICFAARRGKEKVRKPLTVN
jgi:hypothetical protein